jgi:hypothetical protein
VEPQRVDQEQPRRHEPDRCARRWAVVHRRRRRCPLRHLGQADPGRLPPWNLLLPYGVDGQGSLANQELQDFLFPTFTTRGVTKTTSFTANLSGAIVTLPAGDLGFALGVEHRKEEGSYVPDAFAQSGQSTGLGRSRPAASTI